MHLQNPLRFVVNRRLAHAMAAKVRQQPSQGVQPLVAPVTQLTEEELMLKTTGGFKN